MQVNQVLPEHIRASLAQYAEHRQCTCLHCGYSGLMGVHRKAPKFNRASVYTFGGLALGVLVLLDIRAEMKGGSSSVPFWIYALIAIGTAAFEMMKTIFLACPNCNTELRIN